MAGTGSQAGTGRGNMFVPTAEQREMVQFLAISGKSQVEIAKSVVDERGVHICANTLRKHFRSELNEGKPRYLTKVFGRLSEIALNGEDKYALAACMFVLKTQGGFRETNKTEITGPGGGPIKTDGSLKVEFVLPAPTATE